MTAVVWGFLLARPTTYTAEIAAQICGYLAIGESLRKVCRRSGMPAVGTVFRWLGENEEFREQYARAKEEAADMFVEDIIEIADNMKRDKIPKYEINEQTGEKELVGYDESKTSVQRDKVRIDSRKWLAMKLKPKKYGDRLKVDADSNVKAEVTHKVAEMSDEELIRLAGEYARQEGESADSDQE